MGESRCVLLSRVYTSTGAEARIMTEKRELCP